MTTMLVFPLPVSRHGEGGLVQPFRIARKDLDICQGEVFRGVLGWLTQWG